MDPKNNYSTSIVASFAFLLLLSLDAQAVEVLHHWTISYAEHAPLGVDKKVIMINDQFPGPLINATTNDVITVNIHNDLPDPFLMTWNGVQMRRDSWQDGVRGTNCPIMPGENWTYSFEVKDQVGSFFYFPTLDFQKAAGGYGPIRINNRVVIPIPFAAADGDYDVLIGDWYNVDHQQLRSLLDEGNSLNEPDGIVINGLGSNQSILNFETGATYRLRISNVGLKTSLNFRIQDHVMQLVEIEGSYTVKQYYDSLDIHVGQTYSVLVTAKNTTDAMRSYSFVVSSRFTNSPLVAIGIISYNGSTEAPVGPLPQGPALCDFAFSEDQARSIKLDLNVGSARPNPQGSYHYGEINITRTLIFKNDVKDIMGKRRYTVNGISFNYPDTPLKLADYYNLSDFIKPGVIADIPDYRAPSLGTSLLDATLRDFVHIVFINPLPQMQTWHTDGYNFFFVGMGHGDWDESKKGTYNLVDAIWRSTVQVYPYSWSAILLSLDNQGMWNLRSQDAESWYLGQELYIRVKGVGEENPLTIPPRDEAPIPTNVIRCGKALHSY